MAQHGDLPTLSFDDAPRVLIVVSVYHSDITDKLLADAKDRLNAANVPFDIAEVPGALEVPIAIRLACNSDKYKGYVALGCITGNNTLGVETTRSLSELGLQGLCIGNGVLAAESHEQAKEYAKNAGAAAANAALHLIALNNRFNKPTKGIGFKPASENIILAGETDGNKTA
ncbi:6,7-dimethyl-8-ribityllumazine synthase [Amylibacter sp. SFDW26]|uniref:6,7-dimethyl-8-ribityllumazine synthase n=1 Tax=Amylibacter sp. SFDW26 TaxID=2652722 RepID=UPI00126241F7|nr:6,7-dimethyl-8-ribityllumazine synthase [Amylibacter sp. SFDW26]KAB7615335.1 6,7-dimethyl-8-ribityllumazine synthase [Amylibacter sp. SFDW26]